MLSGEEKHYRLSVCLSGVPGKPAWRSEKCAGLSLWPTVHVAQEKGWSFKQRNPLPQAFLKDSSLAFCFLPPHTQDRGRMTRFMSVTLVLPLPSFDHWMYPRRPGRESTESANLGKKNRSRLAIPLSFSLPSLSNHISPSPDPFLLGIYNAWMDGRTDGWMHG